jgi:hypothetical protein
MKKLLTIALFIPSLLFAVANYVYHNPTETSDNPSGYEYRDGVVNGNNVIYDNEAASIAVKVEYNGWIDNVKIAFTTNGVDPTTSDNTTVLDWWGNGTYNGTGEPQVWGKNSVIPQQSVGTTVKYILWAYHSGGGDVIFANGGDDTFHNEESEATVFSYTVQDDSSLPVELSSFAAQSNHRGISLSWITDSEIENQGFIISRKTRTTRWEEIASFSKDRALLGQGSTTDATRYAFLDSQVREGQTYSYLLSDVDYRGQRTNHDNQIQTLTYVIPETPTRPGVLELTRVYPNPFNPATTLSYGLTAASDVSVNIYDLKGELVWNQTQLNQTAGADHQITWQGVNTLGQAVNSGIYLVHIQAGTERISQKVTLLR